MIFGFFLNNFLEKKNVQMGWIYVETDDIDPWENKNP